MMKNNFIKPALSIFLVFAVATATLAQSDSKSFTAKNFTSVHVSSGIDLYLTQGTSESVVIKGNPDILKEIVAEQKGNRLIIKFREGWSWKRMLKQQAIKAYVSYKTLAAISASGGSDVFTQNKLSANTLSLQGSGGSDLKMDISCKNLSVEISGGSDADLTGTADNFNATASGGSDLDATKLFTKNAKVTASGGSDININVSVALEATASGGSDVHYRGNAALRKSTSGGSDVKRVQ